MDNQQWHERWQSGRIGFHEDAPHPLLCRYIATLHLQLNDRVFLPLCGASVDMAYLLEQGSRVVGCELSAIACRKFFNDHGLAYEVHEVDSFACYQGQNIKIYCGDIFALTPALVGPINAIYDRAALVALPAQRRAAYLQKLKELSPKLNMLLITITHNTDEGPPFSTNQIAVEQLFSTYTVSPLETVSDTKVATLARLKAGGKINPQEHAFYITG